MTKPEVQSPEGLETLSAILKGVEIHKEAIQRAEVLVVQEVVTLTKQISDTLSGKRHDIKRSPVLLQLDALQEAIHGSRIGGRAQGTAEILIDHLQLEAAESNELRLDRLRVYESEDGRTAGEFTLVNYELSLPQKYESVVIQAGYRFACPYCRLMLEGSINRGIHDRRQDEIERSHTTLEKLAVMGIFANAILQASEELEPTPLE